MRGIELGDAERGGNATDRVVREVLLEAPSQALGKFSGGLGPGFAQKDHELLAAVAIYGVSGAHGATQRFGQVLQDGVTADVAMGVVDHLEIDRKSTRLNS